MHARDSFAQRFEYEAHWSGRRTAGDSQSRLTAAAIDILIRLRHKLLLNLAPKWLPICAPEAIGLKFQIQF